MKNSKRLGIKQMLRQCGCKIDFHSWELVGKNKRVCKVCGEKEVFVAGGGQAGWIIHNEKGNNKT